MKNKRELIKGKPNTYWEIIRYFDNNKNNDQKISTWNFIIQIKQILSTGPIHLVLIQLISMLIVIVSFRMVGLSLEAQGISYKGTIKKDRMEGTWENSLNESGGFIGSS